MDRLHAYNFIQCKDACNGPGAVYDGGLSADYQQWITKQTDCPKLAQSLLTLSHSVQR